MVRVVASARADRVTGTGSDDYPVTQRALRDPERIYRILVGDNLASSDTHS